MTGVLDSPEISRRTLTTVPGSRTLGTRSRAQKSKPQPSGRRCHCGKKISRYNPNEACWDHTEVKYPRVRGVK